MRYFILFIVLIGSYCLSAQPVGYTYGKTITIQDSQVPGTTNLTDFPVLISITTDANLETVANGGHVESAAGNDIVFYTEDCLTKLDHQLEVYTASTGQLIAWVRVPTLNAQANTVIHMYYGKAGEPSTSTTAVWDSNYRGVWHFQNSINDSSPNGNNLANSSTPTTNTGTGMIGSARNLNNNTDILSSATNGRYLTLSNNFFSGMTNFTFEGWVRLDRTATNWERIFDFGQSTNVNFFLCPSTGTGNPAQTRARITTGGAGAEQGPISGNVTNTGWNHWAVVLDNSTSTMILYKNGASLATASGSVTLTPQNLEASSANYFGRSQYGADHYIDAIFDEFRISNNARSAAWIQASYNNQNTPTSFYAIGSEQAATALCAPLPITLSYFEAILDGSKVNVAWKTSSEINNEYFSIERSVDALSWSEIATVPGAGNSDEELLYTYVDYQPIPGKSYYRLKQTDFDGTISYSKIDAVTFGVGTEVRVYTRPENHELVVELDDVNQGGDISVLNVLGQPVSIPFVDTSSNRVYNTSGLSAGIYIIHVQSRSGVVSEKVVIR